VWEIAIVLAYAKQRRMTMNTHIHQMLTSMYCIIITLLFWLVADVAPLKAEQPDAPDVQDVWQNNRLFTPTMKQREQEKQGGIVIYDGLKDTTVEKAMDKAFDRIQNMMFIRIIHTDKGGQPKHDSNGDVLVGDDDC
jgi:hypothetical protein